MRLVVIPALCLSLVPAASAALIGVNLQPAPDITAGFIQVDYVVQTGSFVANGWALTLEAPPAEPPPDYAILNGGYTIDLALGPAGALQSGSLLITGDIPAIGAGAPLLQATATGFGYMDAPGGSLFDFTFTVTGGSLANASYYPLGSTIGVILNAVTPFSGSFTSNYTNAGTGSTDTAPLVPEPAAALMLLVGLAGCRRPRG